MPSFFSFRARATDNDDCGKILFASTVLLCANAWQLIYAVRKHFQKARVSLARCFYAQRDIYLLDDVLSAVNAEIADRIFTDAIGEWLANKTVLVVTTNLQVCIRFFTPPCFDESQVFSISQNVIALFSCKTAV